MARSFDTCRAPYLNNSSIFNKSPEYCSNKNIYTYHSLCRSKQRCIPEFAIDLVLDYGKATSAGKGAESYSFDNRSWRKVCKLLGADVRRYEKYRNIYVIVAGGTIVTVAWRH
jgi:hypothetical protein